MHEPEVAQDDSAGLTLELGLERAPDGVLHGRRANGDVVEEVRASDDCSRPHIHSRLLGVVEADHKPWLELRACGGCHSDSAINVEVLVLEILAREALVEMTMGVLDVVVAKD